MSVITKIVSQASFSADPVHIHRLTRIVIHFGTQFFDPAHLLYELSFHLVKGIHELLVCVVQARMQCRFN